MKTETIIPTIILITLGFGFILFVFFTNPIDRFEKVECEQLKLQSEQYNEFYLTEWQAEMCAHAQVEINAPIK